MRRQHISAYDYDPITAESAIVKHAINVLATRSDARNAGNLVMRLSESERERDSVVEFEHCRLCQTVDDVEPVAIMLLLPQLYVLRLRYGPVWSLYAHVQTRWRVHVWNNVIN